MRRWITWDTAASRGKYPLTKQPSWQAVYYPHVPSILVDGFLVESRGDHGWPPLYILWHVVKLFQYWGMSGSGKWSHMDQTIIIRSSHVGVSMCLRLIRYSFEKGVQCLLEWFGWTVGHISQFWWQGIKEHGASYSETSISYRLNCWWCLMTNSRNKAIPSSTYLPARMYPTIPWQVKIWSVLFQYAPHIHDDVSLSSPLKGIVLLPNITRSLSDQAIRISITILLKQPWSWFLLNGDGTFRMAIVATHTARMVSIEDD